MGSLCTREAYNDIESSQNEAVGSIYNTNTNKNSLNTHDLRQAMNSSPNDSMQINEPIQSTTLLIRNYPSLVSQPNKVSGNMKELGVGLDPDSPPKTVFVSKMNKIAKKLEMAMKNPQLEKKLAFFKEKYCDIEMRATPLDHSTPFIKRNSTHKTDNNIEKDPRKSFNE